MYQLYGIYKTNSILALLFVFFTQTVFASGNFDDNTEFNTLNSTPCFLISNTDQTLFGFSNDLVDNTVQNTVIQNQLNTKKINLNVNELLNRFKTLFSSEENNKVTYELTNELVQSEDYFATCAGTVGGVLPEDDFDGDGYCNNVDFDDDNDGIPDIYETCNPQSASSIFAQDVTSTDDTYQMVNPELVSDGDTNTMYSSSRADDISQINYYFQATDNVSVIRIYNTDGVNAGKRAITKIGKVRLYDNQGNILWETTDLIVNPNNTSNQDFSLGTVLDNVSRMQWLNTYPNHGQGVAWREAFIRGCDESDADADGLANRFDTDSDNDGCPDAVESNAVSATQGYLFTDLDEQLMVDLPVGTSGTNAGVPGSNRNNGVGAYDATVKMPECDPCDPASTKYNDNDHDGIADFCDLDDDNDGILDNDEFMCPEDSGNIVDYSVNPPQTPLAGLTVPGTAGGFEITHTMTGTAGAWYGPEGSGQPYNIARNGNDFTDPMVMTHQFNTPLRNLYFTFRDIDAGNGGTEHVNIRVYYQGVQLTPIQEIVGENIQVVGQYAYEGRTSNGNTEAYENGVELFFGPQLADKIIITQYHTTNWPNQGVLYNYEGGCVLVDTDNDGIPDYLDLDSDGDGCPDAIEGGASISMKDLADDGSLAQYDANGNLLSGTAVDSDGIPGGIAQDFGDSRDPEATNCISTEPDVNQTPQDQPVDGNVLTNDTPSTNGNLIVTDIVMPDGTVVPVGESGSGPQTIPGVGVIEVMPDGSYTFTPEEGYTGTVPSIGVVVEDETTGISEQTDLTIEVVPEVDTTADNTAPVAQDDTNSLESCGTVTGTISSNDSDIDGDTLTVSALLADTDGDGLADDTVAIGSPTTVYGISEMGEIAVAGTITINADGTYTFQADCDFTGEVIVENTLTDGSETDESTLTLEVENALTNKTFANDDANISPNDTNQTGNLLENDSDPEGDVQSIQSITFTLNGVEYSTTPNASTPISLYQTVDGVDVLIGTITIDPATGEYLFDPQPSYSGTFILAYTVVDSEGNTDTSSVYLTVLPAVPVDFTPILTTYTDGDIVNGKGDMLFLVNIDEVLGKTSNSGPLTIRLKKSEFLNFTYDGAATNVGGLAVDNPNWVFDDSNPIFWFWTTTQTVQPFGRSTDFAFIAQFDSNGTTGKQEFEVQIPEESGGDTDISNNSDYDTIYF